MSFRARMALFFVLIVVIPIAAMALLAVNVAGDSQDAKADARLATGMETALAVYEENAAEARARLTELTAQLAVAAALRSGDPATVDRVLGPEAGRLGLEHLVVTLGSGERVAAVRSADPMALARLEAGEVLLEGSVVGPTGYVEAVADLTGLDVALSREGEVVAASTAIAAGSGLPEPGAAADVEVGGEELRVAAGELPEGAATRVLVLAESETGGFLASSPRIVAVVALFLLVALGSVFVLVRTLQGQVGSMLAAARRIGAGDFSRRIPVVGRDEMAGLAGEFNRMSDRLQAQIDLLRRQRTELDRAVVRMGEAFAAGLDRDALLGIVAETALGACGAEYCRIELEDVVAETPEGARGPARDAALAGMKRAARDGAQVAARREDGHALAAPFSQRGAVAGTMAVGRQGEPFGENEREVFVYLLGQAAASMENITAHERVSEQAVTDELTGLANHRSFRETIGVETARAERFRHELSLIILDIDDFKQVNDTHGHLQGDEVLRAVGRILRSEPRAIDEAARYGGEEFVIALPETGSEGAVELAERIRARLEAEPIASVEGGGPLHVTASFGTATLPWAASSVSELFAAADAALYEAKRSGKNRVATAPDTVRSRR